MVRFECDSCHRLKDPGDAWILGFAAEAIGISTARREVSIASAWDDAQAVRPLAVHFCSDPCRQRYMSELFGEQPAAAPAAGEQYAYLPPATTTVMRISRRTTGAKVEPNATKRPARAKKSQRKAS